VGNNFQWKDVWKGKGKEYVLLLLSWRRWKLKLVLRPGGPIRCLELLSFRLKLKVFFLWVNFESITYVSYVVTFSTIYLYIQIYYHSFYSFIVRYSVASVVTKYYNRRVIKEILYLRYIPLLKAWIMFVLPVTNIVWSCWKTISTIQV
jgi:hypothetical protein